MLRGGVAGLLRGGVTGPAGGRRACRGPLPLPPGKDERTLPGVDSFRRGDLRFDVRDGGPQGGPLVVLLHGFPQDGTAWDEVAALLHEAGVRTLAPDLRGCSPGARPPGRAAYAMAEYGADLIALLDAARADRAHIVGHDWGAMVTWTAAGLHPHRIVTAVALSAPHPAAFGYAVRRGGQALRSWYLAALQLPVLPELVLPRILDRTVLAGLPDRYAAGYAERLARPGALSPALGWYRGLPVSLLTPVPPCPVPVTYGWGRRDPVVGRTAAEATGGQVAGPYRFVELDAGHWLPETRPREVAALILDRVRRGRAA